MGCCSGEREKGPQDESQKWAYITLSDFRCTSAWTYFAYGWLWFLAIIGIAVYVVDTFTAVQLLAYNNWSSQVKPALAFKYSKWIFAVCILISWTLCIYEWIRAIRVIRRGGVAESFLDPLAVDIQSIRPQGFKRFLVFSALAKSKKGADYVALFVYFSFKTAIRVVLAEGPRQGVNAMTLWAVLQSDIAVKAASEHSTFEQFWLNIGALADKDPLQACIYFAMLFTLVIWVFSALSLIISVVLYLVFLWHYIPSRDGRLSVYCKRKVDRRLAKVVEHKVKAAIEEEERQARKEERKAELKRQKKGELAPSGQTKFNRQPTLPEIGQTPSTKSDEKAPDFSTSRQNTDNSLPPYTSRPATRDDAVTRQPTLPNVGHVQSRPGVPLRSDTQASGWSNAPSYASDAPLVSNTGFPSDHEQDYDQYNGPLPPLPHLRSESQSTLNSQRSFRPGGPPGPGPRFPPQRSDTAFSFEQIQPPLRPQPQPMGGYPRAPPQIAGQNGYYPRSVSGPAPFGQGPTGNMMPRSATVNGNTQGYARRPVQPPERSATTGPMGSSQQPNEGYEMRVSPVHNVSAPNFAFTTVAPVQSVQSASAPNFAFTTIPPVARTITPASSGSPNGGGYIAFNPNAASSTNMTPSPAPTHGSQNAPTMRSATAPPAQQQQQSPQLQQTFWQTYQAPVQPLSQQQSQDSLERPYNGPLGPGSIRRPEPPTGGPQRAATSGPRW